MKIFRPISSLLKQTPNSLNYSSLNFTHINQKKLISKTISLLNNLKKIKKLQIH